MSRLRTRNFDSVKGSALSFSCGSQARRNASPEIEFFDEPFGRAVMKQNMLSRGTEVSQSVVIEPPKVTAACRAEERNFFHVTEIELHQRSCLNRSAFHGTK
jgi:hypothetical protein